MADEDPNPTDAAEEQEQSPLVAALVEKIIRIRSIAMPQNLIAAELRDLIASELTEAQVEELDRER